MKKLFILYTTFIFVTPNLFGQGTQDTVTGNNRCTDIAGIWEIIETPLGGEPAAPYTIIINNDCSFAYDDEQDLQNQNWIFKDKKMEIEYNKLVFSCTSSKNNINVSTFKYSGTVNKKTISGDYEIASCKTTNNSFNSKPAKGTWKARPIYITFVQGTVYDNITTKKLSAKVVIVDLKTAKSIFNSYSDSTNGEFYFYFTKGKDYDLSVSKKGYLTYSENINLTNNLISLDTLLKDIPLQPIKKGSAIVLKNIFFDIGKYDLKTESNAELEKLIDLLNQNPKMQIEIGGHTDNVGDENYNQSLSENRAKAVYDYLIKNGINKERLTYKGYGELLPIDTNDTEAGRANNRRTEFKVIDFLSN